MSLKEKLIKEKLPRHVAIIMDGNGRWAKMKGNNRIYGHKNGVKAVKEAVEASGELGIEYLTLYAFSTENWNRPRMEVDALMKLLVSTIHSETQDLHKNNVRLMTIGNRDALPAKVRKELEDAIDKTKENTGLKLVLALSYSGRWELVDAAKKMIKQAAIKELTPDKLDEDLFAQYLNIPQMPDPEILIRTSGEHRISNFLLWQMAYTELFFIEKFWPDFRREDLYTVLFQYQNRERRFGKISEQFNN